jgi:deoxyribose-phosphate aldolase
MSNSICGFIDHTLLKPDANVAQIRQLCSEAARCHFASVCVNPCWVGLCAELLQGTPVIVCTVAAFPLGAAASDIKVAEARRGVADGAREIDMVMNVGLLKSGLRDAVFEDLRRVAEAVHESQARLKVIIETPLLTQEEKIEACRLAQKAGADFVKTATGFTAGGATVEDVALMRRVVGETMGVKASGGIRNLTTAREMIAAGASRIGTSSGVQIAQEDPQSPGS